MTLTFTAKFVRCSDALGGDILQVCFDTMPESRDEDERATPYVLLSQNFEFPGSATIEWHDGSDYDGGGEIMSATLSRDRILLQLDRDMVIDVSFNASDRGFAQLSSYLRRMLDERVFAAA